MIHHHLRALRLACGFSQKLMAEKLHKSPSAYSRMEQGKIKITIDDLPEIATALNCSMDDLLLGQVHPPAKQTVNRLVSKQSLTDHGIMQTLTGGMRDLKAYQEESEARIFSFLNIIMTAITKK